MAPTGNQGPGARQEPHQGTLGGVASAVRDNIQDMASSVASTAENAWDSTRQVASSVAHTAGDAWGDVTGLMRRYPFGTLFVGIGIGFVLSRILEDRANLDFRRLGSDVYGRVRGYATDVASKLHT